MSEEITNAPVVISFGMQIKKNNDKLFGQLSANQSDVIYGITENRVDTVNSSLTPISGGGGNKSGYPFPHPRRLICSNVASLTRVTFINLKLARVLTFSVFPFFRVSTST